ncbi:N(4)-(Beta-N-acetylglucosaminyl)-L-asparaginase-like isoform X1 [Hemicordylus capensis]|uniref:N(4)-(Beta-N-acetylglucosaminyl)-L-asparaginase- like isoform X1 n=1 Tax=Hemicordylus capensis TaxID=884348 RepID=UPI00230409C3|nr:N(4)-(Beta-N-acetylglucosaminyl)-L-asparaginase-like isoform X1 [Hemicordylus capensis]
MAAAAGTWAFSLPAVQKMKQRLLQGGSATDCLQEAMAGKMGTWDMGGGTFLDSWRPVEQDVEDDEETGSFVIGRGGYPNKDGIIQCDAAIMEGWPGRFGAVGAMHGIGTPLAVARKVMEDSPHSFLVGDGAVAFAKDQVFTVEDNRSMMSKRSTEAYQEYLEKGNSLKKHDTLGLIALDIYGNITVGVSTSGAPFKYPGRVGDSPLPGCGLYANKEVGAAAATGDGDKIMCFCPCFHAVLLMKQGLSPMDACQTVVQDILQRTGKENMFELGIIAMNMKGEVGAASSVSFPYCIWSQGKDYVEQLMQQSHQL